MRNYYFIKGAHVPLSVYAGKLTFKRLPDQILKKLLQLDKAEVNHSFKSAQGVVCMKTFICMP